MSLSVPIPLAPPADVPSPMPGASRTEEDRFLQRAFKHHSRTFSLAARLLPQPVRLPIATLYLFCRTVDGLADEYVLAVGVEEAKVEIERTRRRLELTLDGRPPDALLWHRLAEVHEAFGLPPEPLHELLDGALWDIEGRPIETMADLLEYADHVAGSVGAMMLPFLIPDQNQLGELEAPARALGQAMQITNVVRDVGEDWRKLGRVYLPQDEMERVGITEDSLSGDTLSSLTWQGYVDLIELVMDQADALYAEAERGIRSLPINVQRGIRAAARMYREIQNEVRAADHDNLHNRAFVSLGRKLQLIARDDYANRKARLMQHTSE